MSRKLNTQFAPYAKDFMDKFHTETVQEVQAAIRKHDVVVIGMSVNMAVKKVCQALDEQKISYEYLEYGGYFSKWKERLAIKIWSGWPTFPQVFVKRRLIGGCKETRRGLKDGSVQELLAS